MLQFENQKVLYLLFIIIALVAGYVTLFFIDRRRLREHFDAPLLRRLRPDRRKVMPHVKFALCMIALAVFIIAAANPRTPGKEISVTRSGVDVLFCLDVSKSMDAQDVKPNRLEACKMAINHCIDKMNGNRVGAVAFAGTAEVALPATTDYESAKNYINLLNTKKIALQGTNLSEALYRSAAALGISTEDVVDENHQDTTARTQKAIILISDGEDHAEDALVAARKLHEHGILIFTIGIGTPSGATIPDNNDVKRDKDGRPVVTKLNEKILKDIATEGGGEYIHAENVHASFDAIFETIDQMAKSDFGKVKITIYESQYLYPLTAGIILLVIEGFLLAAKPARRARRTIPLLLLVATLFLNGCRPRTIEQDLPMFGSANTQFATADSLNPDHLPYDLPERADSLYHQALRTYQTIPDSLPQYTDKALFNQIAANYRIGNYDSIPQLNDFLLKIDNKKNLTADAYYNTGNSHLANGQYLKQLAQYESTDSLLQLAYKEYNKAIDCYKDCLRLNPSDMDAKYNLMYARKLLPKGGQGQGQGQNQQDQKQDQQQQQNGQGQNQQQQQQQQNGQGQDQQQQGNSGQDQQQQRKEETQQMKQQSGQGEQKDKKGQQEQGDTQQGDKDEQKKENASGSHQETKQKTEDQKALERQLNALKQHEKDLQKERDRISVPVPRQNMEKDW